ncbi:MAG: GntR family transcriptional regulator [Pirellulaceae bacterium]|nr:GntR family transcriptional regulator [Pirellulaceae bacterium]
MFFAIDPTSGVAIYEQIVRQIKFAIAEGTLRPGQMLPSVRTLSQQLAINPNTINRAFQQLQADGVLESLRGIGLAVRATAVESCRQARRQLVTLRLQQVLVEALHSGLTADEIGRLVKQQLSALAGSVTTVSAVAPSTTTPMQPTP